MKAAKSIPLSPAVTQEFKDEEKRWAEVWKMKRVESDRWESDKQRKSGGSPVSGNRPSKTMLLDEVDDPQGEYARAGAAGYDKEPAYPWTKEDVIRHENQVKGVGSWDPYPSKNRQARIHDKNCHAHLRLQEQARVSAG